MVKALWNQPTICRFLLLILRNNLGKGVHPHCTVGFYQPCIVIRRPLGCLLQFFEYSICTVTKQLMWFQGVIFEQIFRVVFIDQLGCQPSSSRQATREWVVPNQLFHEASRPPADVQVFSAGLTLAPMSRREYRSQEESPVGV